MLPSLYHSHPVIPFEDSPETLVVSLLLPRNQPHSRIITKEENLFSLLARKSFLLLVFGSDNPPRKEDTSHLLRKIGFLHCQLFPPATFLAGIY